VFINHISQNGEEEPAFTNVGRWRTDDAGETDAPVYIPWITIDIDNVDLVEAYEDAIRTVNRLEALGYDKERIVCSFSGSKGFHIQIDSTQMGLVPFAGPEMARVFLETYSKSVCLGGYWDASVCSPRSLIRVTGSTHKKTGLRKRSFLAGEFTRRGIDGVMKRVRGDYRAFKWPEGGSITPGPRKHLRDVFTDAESRWRAKQQRSCNNGDIDAKGNGVLNRIKHGVGEGEEFGPRNFHVGRENAAFLVGCKLIESYPQNLKKAYEKLVKWNGQNKPPLPLKRVDAQWRGSKRKMFDEKNIRR